MVRRSAWECYGTVTRSVGYTDRANGGELAATCRKTTLPIQLAWFLAGIVREKMAGSTGRYAVSGCTAAEKSGPALWGRGGTAAGPRGLTRDDY